MSVTTKSITINSNNLGTDATLLLIFDADSTDPILHAYEDFYPFVLRLSSFGGTGHYATTLKYTNQLSFVKPEEGSDGKMPGEDYPELAHQARDSSPATWIEIKSGEKTTLTFEGGIYRFTNPTALSPSMTVIQAWNECAVWENIVLGYRKNVDTLPQSTWLFPRIGSGFDITARFTPTLRAYIVDPWSYRENQILRQRIPESPIWTQDLRLLDGSTDWKLVWEAASGRFSIVQIF